MVKVDIEYCGYCDFQSECEALAKTVKIINPSAEVKCRRGRKGSFEVRVNENLIYSKLNSEYFPNAEEVAKQVQNVIKDERKIPSSTSHINDSNNSTCSLM